MNSEQRTDWENTGRWYDQIVGQEGHYYHRQIVLPKLLPLLDLGSFDSPSLLDLACGQGILARQLPPEVPYWGVDLAPSLIAAAKKKCPKNHHFLVGDICKPLPVDKQDFTHAAIVLALQNVAHPEKALLNASRHLREGGVLALVLNHPCFRIPRQSAWGVDAAKKLQYRRIDAYLSPQKIPIQMHPGKGKASETTWSFHHSISDFSKFLADAGFAILLIEEWVSDKTSTGHTAKMENRARAEFPLFLTFLAQKIA
ncbi:class I SAM-dependent methyltransferase [Chlamydiota bacterium]